jgi:hypothetical protein
MRVYEAALQDLSNSRDIECDSHSESEESQQQSSGDESYGSNASSSSYFYMRYSISTSSLSAEGNQIVYKTIPGMFVTSVQHTSPKRASGGIAPCLC